MATNLDIIKRAMKKIHVLASGAEPTATQAADGLVALQGLIGELISSGSLGRLNDVLATSSYTAREFDRIQASHGVTITIPTTITPSMCSPGGDAPYDYGRSWSSTGETRPPRDRACIIVVQDGAETDYVWSGYRGSWVQIQAMTQQGTFPFAANLENGFAAMLAERIVDDFAQELGNETKLQAGRCRMSLALRHDSALAETPAHYF